MNNNQIKIWEEFTANGKEFWIQNVQKEYSEVIMNAMANEFIKEEPLAKYGKIFEASVMTENQKKSTYNTLQKGQSIMCMTRDEFNNPIVAGFHLQEISPYPMNEKEFSFVRPLLLYMLHFRNILCELGVDKFLLDKGLFVFPKFRGYGIGHHLLKCWPLICKDANVKVGLGIFSSKYSQSSAKHSPLIDLKYLSYKDIRKDRPDDIPLGIEEHTEGLKLCYVYPSM